MYSSVLRACALFSSAASALGIAEINGKAFVSPYDGEQVSDVSGLVTAKGPNGFWIRSTTPDDDDRTSESVYIYGSETLDNVTIGDVISLVGQVYEYRSSDDYLYLTEVEDAENISVTSNSNSVEALVLGQGGLNPPTEQYTSLDDGDVLGFPNNRSLLAAENSTLEPKEYGLDFWESLSGELVTVTNARAISKPNNYGDTWVVGGWNTTGTNSRGGLTLTPNDGNPEAILIGSPLDGTSNPNSTKLGDSLASITGIVSYAFGFYRILPLTALSITASQTPPTPPPTTLHSSGNCSALTLGQYNVENLAPDSAHLPAVASQIVHYLHTPDLLFLQEVQDNSGPTDDGVVSANQTLNTLIDAIASASNTSTRYAYAEIPPVDGTNGGQPGGNIRNAYLYNPSVLRLVSPSPSSLNTSITPATISHTNSSLTLSPNPALIDPLNEAWENSRKPLVALFETVAHPHSRIWAVNVHFTSKGGSTSFHASPRPPLNSGAEERTLQANLTASFIHTILASDPSAAVVAAGDFNEFAFARPLRIFEETSGLAEMDAVVGLEAVERYTYVFDMNSQQLDHMYVSPGIVEGEVGFEHVHVSSWVGGGEEVSDHDPSVGRVDIC